MSNFDDRVRRALEGEGESEAAGALDRIGETFLKQSRSLMVLGIAKMVFFVAAAAGSAVMFYRSTDPKTYAAWAAIFVVMLLSLGIGFVLYWLELFRNSVMREIKRMEIRVTRAVADRRA
jgi:hypothetical protein